MFKYSTTLYLALWNALALGLIAMGYAYGYVGPVFAGDHSGLTYVCAALLAVTIVYTTWKGVELDRMEAQVGQSTLVMTDRSGFELYLAEFSALPDFLKAKVFLYLGLAGTVIGLSLFAQHMAMSGEQASAAAITATLKAMQGSMQTAFYATLAGIVCKVWVEVITYIQGRTVSRLLQV